MTATATSPGPRSGEVPLTLDEPPPKVLGWLDQIGLWGNLGVTLLAPVGAVFVLVPGTSPQLSFVAAGLAVVVGTLIGALMLGAAAVPGVQTDAPAMVLMRGLFGRRLSYFPTVINIVQLLGWTVFEIVVISSAAKQVLPWHDYRWPYVLVAGLLTAAMTIRPLGSVRILRRYALVAVVFATTYLFIELLRHPHSSLTHGSWSGFWAGADVAVAVAVSWAPLAADYTRHARSARSAFASAVIGYSVTQIAGYLLGLLALATVVRASDLNLQHDMFAAFIAVPVGWLAFGVLVLRELDESFADGYSAVVSLQNVWPHLDRRLFTVVVCGLATVGALWLNIASYVNFLYLLASVLVPLVAVFLVDYFGTRRLRGWDITDDSPARPIMVAPWLVGFVVYQLLNPGYIGWWERMWHHVDRSLHLTVQTWMSASVFSFVVAAITTAPLVWSRRRRMMAR
ncbi:MAG TPA: cytosine permease [Mycobacteriales bacterium]|jgi:putative hydroxymethylpyrimidine transporter CytX|nr:cytosine permease [Mycobacteriales bacterium]